MPASRESSSEGSVMTPGRSQGKRVLILFPATWVLEECCVYRSEEPRAPGAALLAAALLRKRGHNPLVMLVPHPGRPSNFQPDAVVLYAPSFHVPRLAPLVEEAKVAWPRAQTILVQYESLADLEEQALRLCPQLDYAVLPNEKELSLAQIIEYGGCRCPGGFGPGSGIVWRDADGQPVSDGRRAFSPDLSHLPYAGDELELFLKVHPHLKFKDWLLVYQRGCPQGCTFCPVRRTRARYRDPEVMAREVAASRGQFENGGKMLTLEVFAQPAALDSLLDHLLKKNIPLAGGLGARCEYIDDLDLLRKARRAGAERIYIGVEAATQPSRARLQKGFSDQRLQQALDLAQRAGLGTVCSFISGFPWEDLDYLKAFRSLLLHLSRQPVVKRVNLARLIPYNGLPVTREMVAAGIMPHEYRIEEWDRMMDEPVWPWRRSETLGARDLETGFRMLHQILQESNKV